MPPPPPLLLPLLLLVLALLLLHLPPTQAFHYYLVEEQYCSKTLEVGEKIMGRPIQAITANARGGKGGMAMSYELILTRMLDGDEGSSSSTPQRLRHGDVYVPGERVRVSLQVSAAGASTEKESRKLRVQWVAEVGTEGGLASSSSNSSSNSSSSGSGKFYSSKEEPTSIRACPKEGVMRAVPEGGDDYVVWELPSEARGEGGREGWQEATIRVAFAVRYGTVYLTEGLTLRRRKMGKRSRFMNGGGGGGGGGGGREGGREEEL